MVTDNLEELGKKIKKKKKRKKLKAIRNSNGQKTQNDDC